MRKRAAVLGHPIKHSLSPKLHRAGYEALGLDYEYEAIDITEDQLLDFLVSLDQTWVGLSLTMPLKERVTEIISNSDQLVRLTKSANTVCMSGDEPTSLSNMSLTNTDVFGIEKAVTQTLDTAKFDRILVLGSGATARSALAASKNLGATTVDIQARNSSTRNQVVQIAGSLGMASTSSDLDLGRVGEYDLVISTLPSGATGVDNGKIPQNIGTALLDVAYSPWPSQLAALWPNTAIVSGKEMLLWQATKQFELFTGLVAPVSAMRRSIS